MSDGSIQVTDQIPARIGRYQITGSLGFGAMGAVYKAFDPLIKRSLAVKTIRLDIPRSSPQYSSFIERFHHEAQISGTLSHPGIVTLFDLGEENGLPYFAMEFVDGRTIAQLIEAGERFKPEKVVGLVSQLAAALDYAHSRGVVHRDIKPGNLMLYDGDKIKITDFGIAKLAHADLTHGGALVGTPSYMSPEQAMGEKLDGRSDIFSLGVVAFEMLSGLQPFPGPNVTSILYKLVHTDPIEPGDLELLGLLPHKWREVFHKVLAKKPERRYQTASAFVQDLELCLGSWFSGLGNEATVSLAAVGDAVKVDIRQQALPLAAARRGAAAPLAARDDDETGLIPRDPQLEAADLSGATQVLDASLREASEPAPPPTLIAADEVTALEALLASATQPPEPTLRSRPGLAMIAPALRNLLARIPRPVVLGGGAAALLALVLLVAWGLRPRQPVAPAVAPALATVAEPPSEPVAQPVYTPAPAGIGTLRVVSDPAGARVLVDGRARGRSPLELGELAFGSYEVRVEQPGYEPERRRVLLSANAALAEVRLALKPHVADASAAADFVSTPGGAAISLDGKPAGETPLRGVKLQPGRHVVEMSLDGHETWSGSLDVTAGATGRLEVRLRPRPEDPPTAEPVDVSRVYPNEPGQVETLARKLSGASPSYPSGRAPRLRSGQRVSVLVRFVVTEAGAVEDVVVVESAGTLVDDIVVAAVRGWKFEPATKGGVRVKVETTIRQTFQGA